MWNEDIDPIDAIMGAVAPARPSAQQSAAQTDPGPSSNIVDSILGFASGRDEGPEMNAARARAYRQQDQDVTMLGSMVPFASTAYQFDLTRRYGAAKRRIEAGEGQRSTGGRQSDFDLVAQYEAEQHNRSQQGIGTKILRGLTHVPAMIGEAVAGGAAVRGLGLGGQAVSAAAEAQPLLTSAGLRTLAGEIGSGFGRMFGTQGARAAAGQWAATAATAAAMPSMYLEGWGQRAAEAGRDPLSLASIGRDLPPAFALGFMQTAVLGSLGKVGNAIPGAGVIPFAQRLGVRTVTGMGEQQAVDVLGGVADLVLPETFQLKTRFGLLGSAFRGEWGEAMQHAAVQAATFAAFSALHPVLHGEPQADLARQRTALAREAAERMKPFQAVIDAMASQGISREGAGRQITQIMDSMTDFINRNPSASRREGREFIDSLKLKGPLEAFGRSLTEVLPERSFGPFEQRGRERQGELPREQPAGSAQRPAEGMGQGPSLTGMARQEGGMNPQHVQEIFGHLMEGEAPPKPPEPARGPVNPLDQFTESRSVARPEAPPTPPVPEARPEVPPTPPEAQATPRMGVPGASTGIPGAEVVEVPVKKPSGFAPRAPGSEIPRLERAGERELRDRIAKAGLTDREAAVISERYLRGRTLDEIGSDMKISRQRIEQIEKRAKKKLGLDVSAAEFNKEQGFLDFDPIRQNQAELGDLGFSQEQLADPETRAAVSRALAPLTLDEVYAAKLDSITTELLKAEKNASRKGQRLTEEERSSFNARIVEETRRYEEAIASIQGRQDQGPARESRVVAEPEIDPRTGRPLSGEGPGTPAAPGVAEPAPPAGTPGAAAPEAGPELPPKPPDGLLRKAGDFFRSFANQTFPSLTRLNRVSAEKLAEAANAHVQAKDVWNHLSRIIKVGGKSLAEMTPEERRIVGATWLERRFREFRTYLESRGEDASKVVTLVGQEGSPLKTEADYVEMRDNLNSFWEAIKQEWTPVVEKNFRNVMGMDADNPINSPSQIPGLPINAIALEPGELGKPGVVGTGRRQGMENVRLTRPGFTKQAGLDAPAYDVDVANMMQRTLNVGFPAGSRVEFLRTALKEGVIKGLVGEQQKPEGWRYLGLEPSKGLPNLEKTARYYVHPDAYGEVIQGLGIAERAGGLQTGIDVVRPVVDKVYQVALMSPVELTYHIGNHFTALFKSGMGVPVVNAYKSIGNAWEVWQKNPDMLRKVAELSRISASFSHEARTGILGEKLQKWDPTNYINKFTSHFIDSMQKGVRISLGEAYDRMVQSGHFQDRGDTGKRDFINQAVGNYNNHANNGLTQILKDSGLQGFATATHTYATQGIKTALGGAINAKATSLGKAMELRAVAMLKLMPILAMGPVINYLVYGQAFPKGIPAFAIKTREDDETHHYFDPLGFTGLRRGWRATGQNALIEAMIHPDERTTGQVADRAMRDAWLTFEHMIEGPPGRFLHTARTGEDALGRRVAAHVSTATTLEGLAAGARRGDVMPHQSYGQGFENAKAAFLGLNPTVASLTQKDRKPTAAGVAYDTLMSSLGPFGERQRRRELTPQQRRSLGMR